MHVIRGAVVALVVVVVLASCASAGPSPGTSQQPVIAPSARTEPTVPAPSSLAVVVPTPTPALTPGPSVVPQRTAAPIPAKPSGVTFEVVRQVETKDGYRETYRVTWKSPRRDDIVIRVWGVTRCLSEPKPPKPGTSGPCLVARTPLPAAVLDPIAHARASAGKVTWTWDTVEYCDTYDYLWKADPSPDGKQYFAVVVSAYTPSSHSVFAIPFPGSWSVARPTDVVC